MCEEGEPPCLESYARTVVDEMPALNLQDGARAEAVIGGISEQEMWWRMLIFTVGLFLMLAGPVLLALAVAYCLIFRRPLDRSNQQQAQQPAHRCVGHPGVRPAVLPTSESWDEEGSGEESDTEMRLPVRMHGTRRDSGEYAAVCPEGSIDSPAVDTDTQGEPSSCLSRTRVPSPEVRFTTVCFRTGDWRARLQKPLVMGIRLDDVQTVPVRSRALHGVICALSLSLALLI